MSGKKGMKTKKLLESFLPYYGRYKKILIFDLFCAAPVSYTHLDVYKRQGQEIGNSLCEADKLDYALEMIKKAEEKGVKLLLPVDHVEGKEFSNDTEHKVVDVIDAGWSGSVSYTHLLVWKAGMENMHGRIGYLSGLGIYQDSVFKMYL